MGLVFKADTASLGTNSVKLAGGTNKNALHGYERSIVDDDDLLRGRSREASAAWKNATALPRSFFAEA